MWLTLSSGGFLHRPIFFTLVCICKPSIAVLYLCSNLVENISHLVNGRDERKLGRKSMTVYRLLTNLSRHTTGEEASVSWIWTRSDHLGEGLLGYCATLVRFTHSATEDPLHCLRCMEWKLHHSVTSIQVSSVCSCSLLTTHVSTGTCRWIVLYSPEKKEYMYKAILGGLHGSVGMKAWQFRVE